MTLDEAFAHLMTLKTNRLCICPIRLTDAEALFKVKSDPKVTNNYGREPHLSIDETIAWIQRTLADYERHETMMWVIKLKEEDIVIGECCFWNFDADLHYAEIGYELYRSQWNKGIMTEALKAVLSYGFVDLGLNRIEATPLAINPSSQHLLIKLGFKHEGTLRQRILFQGKFEDQLCFGLLREEWIY